MTAQREGVGRERSIHAWSLYRRQFNHRLYRWGPWRRISSHKTRIVADRRFADMLPLRHGEDLLVCRSKWGPAA